jgi:hypothetical protein
LSSYSGVGHADLEGKDMKLLVGFIKGLASVSVPFQIVESRDSLSEVSWYFNPDPSR